MYKRQVYERLVDVAKGAALMTGTQLEVEYLGGCYDTLNNSVLEEVVHRAMLETRQEPWTGEEIAYASELNLSLIHIWTEIGAGKSHAPAFRDEARKRHGPGGNPGPWQQHEV